MRSIDQLLRAAVALACVSACPFAAAKPPIAYHVTLIDPPGETQPLLGGINAQAHVAGAAILPGKAGEHALLLSATRFIDLGTLGGKTSFATAVNASNAVVGTASTATNAEHAFLWQQGHMTDLGTLPGGNLSQAEDVNAAGQVAGFAAVSPSIQHAFVYAAGVMTDLGTLPGASSSAGRGINAGGHVVGDSGSAGVTHAFLWRDGQMTDLGTLGGAGSSSAALAVNDADQAVGASWDPATGGATTATLWHQGLATSLGVPADAGATSSYARAINGHGIVVGTFERDQSALPQGGFISDGTRIANLEDLLDAASAGWQVYSAMGIDDANEVSVLVWDGTAFRFAVLVPD